MEKLEEAEKPANTVTGDRPYSLPGIFLGTSAFTANGWEGSFYPRGMQSRDFLSYYATQFATVEVDSTFYGCPSARTVNNWAARTPGDFIFSVKALRTTTMQTWASNGKALYGLVGQERVNCGSSFSRLHYISAGRRSISVTGKFVTFLFQLIAAGSLNQSDAARQATLNICDLRNGWKPCPDESLSCYANS
jgi:uncharacterized protein YecE (DUF72 family)